MKLFRRDINGSLERYLAPVNIIKIAPVTAIITANAMVSSYALKELPDILFPQRFEYAYVGSLMNARDDNDVADLLDAGAVYILDYEAYNNTSPINWMGYYPIMDVDAYNKALSTNEDYMKLSFIWNIVYNFFPAVQNSLSNDIKNDPALIAQVLDRRIEKIGLPTINIRENYKKTIYLREVFEAIQPNVLSVQYEPTKEYIRIVMNKMSEVLENNVHWTAESVNCALDAIGMNEIDEAILKGVPFEDIEK